MIYGSQAHIVVIVQLCPTLCDSTDCRTLSTSVLHYFPELLKFTSIELAMLSNHLIFCCPLLFLPSIFPSLRVFSNDLALHIRWPKYWSFSFSISPSREYSRLISFRIDWFDLLAFPSLPLFKSRSYNIHLITQSQITCLI